MHKACIKHGVNANTGRISTSTLLFKRLGKSRDSSEECNSNNTRMFAVTSHPIRSRVGRILKNRIYADNKRF